MLTINVLLIAAPPAAAGRAHLVWAGRDAVLQCAGTPSRSSSSRPSPRVQHCWCCSDSALILHVTQLSGGCPGPGCPGLSGCLSSPPDTHINDWGILMAFIVHFVTIIANIFTIKFLATDSKKNLEYG